MTRSHSRRMLRSLITVSVAGVLSGLGCGGQAPKVLGSPPDAAANASVREIAHTSSGKSVTLRGEMTEKCPVAGCWFMLKDKTGIVRIDTKASGFVVSEVPLHSVVTVTGTVIAGTQPGFAATGVRY